jgi:hypothetical protein
MSNLIFILIFHYHLSITKLYVQFFSVSHRECFCIGLYNFPANSSTEPIVIIRDANKAQPVDRKTFQLLVSKGRDRTSDCALLLAYSTKKISRYVLLVSNKVQRIILHRQRVILHKLVLLAKYSSWQETYLFEEAQIKHYIAAPKISILDQPASGACKASHNRESDSQTIKSKQTIRPVGDSCHNNVAVTCQIDASPALRSEYPLTWVYVRQ